MKPPKIKASKRSSMQNYKFIHLEKNTWKKKDRHWAFNPMYMVRLLNFSFCHKCHLVKNIASLNTAGIYRCQLFSGKISCIVISVHCWIFVCEIVKSKLVFRKTFIHSTFCFETHRDDSKSPRNEVSFIFERLRQYYRDACSADRGKCHF